MNEDRELVIKNVKKVYGNPKKNEAEVTALKDATFSIEKGELVVILGPSGAGKTTLLNILGGMDNASSGDYILNGKNITKMSERELAKFRRNDIGFVFQFYNLIPNLTVEENISLVVKRIYDKKKIKKLCDKYLDLVGIKEYKNYYPQMLSGGLRQRVNIARSFIYPSKIIIMDEPFKSIDVINKEIIMNNFKKILEKEKRTVLFVTHDIDEAILLSDKIYVLGNSPVEIKSVIENKNITKDKLYKII